MWLSIDLKGNSGPVSCGDTPFLLVNLDFHETLNEHREAGHFLLTWCALVVRGC